MHRFIQTKLKPLTLAIAGAVAAASAGADTGPSTYVVPTVSGVTITSILTVGDLVNSYAMVGIPDGLGAYANNGDGTFTVLMNH
jgi:hypothetical protein